jgi:iron complex transport system permease protein
MGVLVLACVGASTLAGRAMDAAALGDDEARSVGVNVGGLRALAFVLAGVLSAAAVVLAGPIGFVGLVAPHVVRLLAGPSHRTLIVGSALAGAALVLLADSGVAGLRALGFAGGRPPLSVLTSLVGGPVFIGLLRRRQRGSL